MIRGDREEWVCIFPGKLGSSWKIASYTIGTKEEAEAKANEYSNVVAVPLRLAQHLKEVYHCMDAAKSKLNELGIRMDCINGYPVFVSLNKGIV